MNKYRQRTFFKKYFEIFKTEYIINLLQNKEYKGHLFSVLLFDIIISSVYIMYYNTFFTINTQSIHWESYDYITFWFLLLLSVKIFRHFIFKNLNNQILSGQMNTYLTKPMHPYFQSFINSMNSGLYPK